MERLQHEKSKKTAADLEKIEEKREKTKIFLDSRAGNSYFLPYVTTVYLVVSYCISYCFSVPGRPNTTLVAK